MLTLVSLASPRRLIASIFAIVLAVHYLFSLIYQDYARLSSWSHLRDQLITTHNQGNITNSTLGTPESNDPRYFENVTVPLSYKRRANATFVFLCRNNEINDVVTSVQQMEDRFNKRYNYPWVFLNEEPFTEEFKQRISVLTDAPVSFGLIPKEHWFQPEWINENRARAGRIQMMAQGIIYAVTVHREQQPAYRFRYRNMCRFNSGFFFKHELLQQYRYYWRPGVQYFCDLNYDPFVFMEENNKVYGFTISLVEWEPTIRTLWPTVKEFIAEHPEYVEEQNSMAFLSDNDGQTYNLCHYWSNFEIADMEFWRGEAYQKFFEYLESKGGFYYERWGDAPVHSIAVSLFARRDQIHFFRDIGYRHSPFQHCPSGSDWEVGRCACDPNDRFDYAPNSCLLKYESLFW
ncbi:glycosyltransferase family 15 protein [Amanita thiersii Skay4041]|uniref:Glycosyltransferase family 15 protein n=1 Tax=Amanita thiersii Skay4041 TaxID=703135 RepID=A0A2A9NXU7_9AGAR|nr:glycosyltransferase family 15 protein [Amanita thiersii Skay4041]